VRQYLIEHRGHTPSAALIKAIVVNGAVDMGMGLPHNGQGWGRLELNNALFPAGSRRIQFDDSLDNAVATTETRTYEVFVSTAAEPLAVTLVWRDPAGATIQNRLHLRVTHVATGATTTADPITNIRNNVQKVVIDTPDTGLYRIEVEGVSVSTGIPELSGLHQDFALVVANVMGFSCNPSDIVQVIDRSGSMGFSGYIEPAKHRAKQMIDILQVNDRAGLVTFADSAATGDPLPLTPINTQDDKDDAHDLIDPVTAGGNTDLREALDDGLATLGADTGRPRAMVFISDGKHTVPTAPIDDAFLDSIDAANVRVYTIALGPASDFGVLNNIAARTGTGAVYTVASAADLHKLHEIYYDIIGGIGCGSMAHLSSDAVHPERHLTHKIMIDSVTREALFAFSWTAEDAEFECRLVDPGGTLYRPGSKSLFQCGGKTHFYYRVARPEPGTWMMEVKSGTSNNWQTRPVTTAVMVDSEVKCRARLDAKYLYHGLVLLSLEASYNDKPILNATTVARITYPTVSTETLLERYKSKLAEIQVNQDQLKGDSDDLELIKLDLLTRQMKEKSEDIYQSKSISMPLTDDGKEGDPAADDGIYTAFFNPRKAKAIGNFTIEVWFEAISAEFGTRRCTRHLPVCLPSVAPELTIKKIFSRRNVLWRHTIIGAAVLKGDGQPAMPADGAKVDMTVVQGRKKAVLKNVPFYRPGGYYIWRFREPGFKTGKARVEVKATMGSETASAKEDVDI
jgi:hypothetical protein